MSAVKNKPTADRSGGQARQVGGGVLRRYYNTKGQNVAELLPGGILLKRVRRSIHQLRAPAAWAIDQSILEAARRDGALVIAVEDIESGGLYFADLSTFDRHGFTFDRGHGLQVGLPVKYWTDAEQGAVQLCLFGFGGAP